MYEQLAECTCGRAGESGGGQSLNEEAFHYVLDVERRRSDRTRRPFLLMAIDLRSGLGSRLPIGPTLGRTLFRMLERRLRATDFVGWLHRSAVIGVVMTELGDRLDRAVAEHLRNTIKTTLRGSVPAGVDLRVRVRAYRPAAGRVSDASPIERVA